ncbi:MAG: cellulase family glycosylhydrolase [Clostridia bacterium]|nr:cellulase family glycosylhydrolase [Clostridia bacterium]
MKILENESFYAGCNYWASESGIYMWRNWNEKNVDDDFRLLSDIGIKCVRAFPLWSDFQPIKKMYSLRGNSYGISVDDGKNMLSTFDDGVDEVMLGRFEKMLDIADKYGIKIIPSILTGWMSGRLFIPPALEELNLINDPYAIYWEVKFVKAFVTRFKNHPAVAAWCIGNECNCMGVANTKEEAWLWVNTISSAIRISDNSRPVISGMHSLKTEYEGVWTLQDSGLCCDFLTTHPYASPTYGTDKMKINTIFPMLHPAAQTLFYAGIGKKPCFIEETGTFGQMYCDDEFAAKYVEATLYTSWSHNCLSFLWWIGFDQGSLNYYPFSYNNRASNYGLYREDKTLKPVGEVIKKFNEFQQNLPFEKLPERITDAVCILSPHQNTWNAGYSAFVLAKQAKIDLEFAFLRDEIPDSKVYFMPSVGFTQDISIDGLNRLMKRVENGAVLYISAATGFMRNLSTDFGFHINYREQIDCQKNVHLDDEEMTMFFNIQYNIDVEDAKVLATDDNGNPVFLQRDYGKGKLLFLMSPVENFVYGNTDAFEKNYYKIYSKIKEYMPTDKIVECDNPMVGVTEHIVNENERICVVTAYTDCETSVTLTAKKEWKTEEKTDFTLSGSETKVIIFKK